MESGRNREDPYRKTTKKYAYIYFSGAYHISTLENISVFNYYGDKIENRNSLNMVTEKDLSGEGIKRQIEDGSYVETNISRKTTLFRAIQKKIKMPLRERYEDNLHNGYQDLIGSLYDKDTRVKTDCLNIIIKLSKLVDFHEKKYPPELISLSQISGHLARFFNPIEYDKFAKNVPNLKTLKTNKLN